MPVAVVTAAAHAGGKAIALGLADAGFDVVFWGLAALRTRCHDVEARGRRALSLRGNILDPVSVRFLIADTTAVFPTVDAVVHVAADHLAIDADGNDPATAALVAAGAKTVVYVDDGHASEVAERAAAARRAGGLSAAVVATATEAVAFVCR
jgi:hypothetical protein